MANDTGAVQADSVVSLVQKELTGVLADSKAAQSTQSVVGQQQTMPIPDFSWSGYIQGLGMLFLLLGLLWFAVRLLRKYGTFSFIPRPGDLPRGALRMEAQMPLGPRKGLMVVRFLDTRFLLGVTEQQITVLSREQMHDDDATRFAKLMEQHQEKDT